MYEIELTESLFPAQTDMDVLETTVGDLLRDIAGRHGDVMALVEIGDNGDAGRDWTYGQMLADSERLALALASRFKPGERICIWAPNIPEWLLMEYACALAGLVMVTANPAYQAKELEYVLAQSGAVGLFLVKSYRGNPMADIAVAACNGIKAVREIIDLEDAGALYRNDGTGAELPTVLPTDAVQIQYTSGTTGFPKGAVLTHRGLVNNARYSSGRGKTHGGTVRANFMPMFHTAGCGMAALGCLQAACKMLMVRTFDPAVVADLVAREKVTALLGVPTMLVGILEFLGQNPRDMSSVEMVTSGGSMVAPELVRDVKRVFGCDFQTVYGQTETSPVVTQHFADDSIDDICNSIGQPLPQTAISIRNTGDNKVVPIDVIGEICIQGYCNMIGYNGNEAATAETIDDNGWLHTGDLGAMDGRGYFRITGRVKEMIIRGGENLFPAEIENLLLEHPDVAEVAVVGLPDDKWGEIVACFIRPREHQELDPIELHSYCRQHIAPHKTPVVWCRVDDMPLTGSGKIQKFALRDGCLAGKYPQM